MNLDKILRQLNKERAELDKLIAALETQVATAAKAEVPKKRRGRKFMDKKARKEVSERMNKYWAARKKPGHLLNFNDMPKDLGFWGP